MFIHHIPKNDLGGLMNEPLLTASGILSHAFPLLSVGFITCKFIHFQKCVCKHNIQPLVQRNLEENFQYFKLNWYRGYNF